MMRTMKNKLTLNEKKEGEIKMNVEKEKEDNINNFDYNKNTHRNCVYISCLESEKSFIQFGFLAISFYIL